MKKYDVGLRAPTFQQQAELDCSCHTLKNMIDPTMIIHEACLGYLAKCEWYT